LPRGTEGQGRREAERHHGGSRTAQFVPHDRLLSGDGAGGSTLPLRHPSGANLHVTPPRAHGAALQKISSFRFPANGRGHASCVTVVLTWTAMPDTRETLRFRDFELDVSAYQLRRQGQAVRLERRPMDLLIMLVERRRQLVTRTEIVDRLWGKDVFVDVETGVNTVVFKVRQALRDSPDAPAYVETVPGKGYRFIAPVEVVPGPGTAPSWVTLGVLPVENLSGDPAREYLADGLAEDTIAALAQIDPEHVGVIGRTSVMAYKRTTRSLGEIGHDLNADYLVESSLRAENDRLRITSKLIRVRDQVQVWSETYD